MKSNSSVKSEAHRRLEAKVQALEEQNLRLRQVDLKMTEANSHLQTEVSF